MYGPSPQHNSQEFYPAKADQAHVVPIATMGQSAPSPHSTEIGQGAQSAARAHTYIQMELLQNSTIGIVSQVYYSYTRQFHHWISNLY